MAKSSKKPAKKAAKKKPAKKAAKRPAKKAARVTKRKSDPDIRSPKHEDHPLHIRLGYEARGLKVGETETPWSNK